MLRRFFGSEKAPQEATSGQGTGSVKPETLETSLRDKVDNNRSSQSLSITHSLPDLTINTSSGNYLERTHGEQRQEILIHWPKDSLESVTESVCSDPVAVQFQNQPGNVYRSVENLLGVKKNEAPRRVFSLKKSLFRSQNFEDLPKHHNPSLSNSASLLSVDSQASDMLKSETRLDEVLKAKAASKEKAATLGSHSLLEFDGRSDPVGSEELPTAKNSKRSKSRIRSRTLTGLELLKPRDLSKSPVPETDGAQSDRDNLTTVSMKQKSEWRSSSVKGASKGKYLDVTGTPSKADHLSARAALVHVPISKLDDHLVLALDGLEQNSEVQVVKIDASSLLFEPEKLATFLEDTWHINKALINLNCIAVLLPSSRHSSTGLSSLLPQFSIALKKLCVAKGNVAMSRIQGTWSYSRYLMLTSEDLLILKQKTTTSFKLKKRVAVSDLWLAPHPGQSVEMGGNGVPLAFIIGWPIITNYILLFTKAEQKMMWMTLLEKLINDGRQKDHQHDIVIRITTQDTDYTMTKSLVVSPEETACQVVQRCLKELHLIDSEARHFELCVKSRDNIVPLIGHEIPYYIQQQNSKEQDFQDRISPQDRMPVAFDHFVLRPMKTPPRNAFRRRPRNRRLTLVSLFGRKTASPQPDVLQSMPQPKLFGRSLSEVCQDASLPKPMLDLLRCLYIHGPTTPGIFRKSGNHRDLMELKARLDAGEECNMEEVSIHVAAAAVKHWLRSLPECLLLSSLYNQWIEAICITDSEQKTSQMESLIKQLPNCNLLLLHHIVCVLHRVSLHAERNHMTSGNLAICLGPTVLWPEGSVDLTSECVSVELVARVTQMLIDDAQQILGEDSLQLFKGSVEEIPLETELNFDSEDSVGSHEVLNSKGDLEKGASLESLDNYSLDDALETVSNSFSAVQSQMSVDSGVAVSNPRLNDEPELPVVIIQVPSDQPRYAKRLLGTKKKVHTKSELSDISEALTIQDAEERPNSKLAGASNVRERISRFQASRTHTDDGSFSCGESSDDEFLQTSNSSREFEDNTDFDESDEDNGLLTSTIMKRALPAPVMVMKPKSNWSSRMADVSTKIVQNEIEKPPPTLIHKISKDLGNTENDWYFMGPEENVQSTSNIRHSKSKYDSSSRTSDNFRAKQDKFSPNYSRLSSTSLRSERSEPSVKPVKQSSLDNETTGIRNPGEPSSLLFKHAQAAMLLPSKMLLDHSDSIPLQPRLTSFEVLKKPSSQHINSSPITIMQSPANSASFNSSNLNSDSSSHRSDRNKSVPRRVTVALNTTSRGVQTEPLHDQNISGPTSMLRRSSLILPSGEMNNQRIESNGIENQNRNQPLSENGRRFKSDLGLSCRRSWREDYADAYGDENLRTFTSPPPQNSQTENYVTRGRSYALGNMTSRGEQVRSFSEDSDHGISHQQVRRSSVHNVTSPRHSTDQLENDAPISIEQRIRDRRAVTVVTIGDASGSSRNLNNKLTHPPTNICIPAKESSTSDGGSQYSDSRGSKVFSDDEPLKNNGAKNQLDEFYQAVNSRSAQGYATRSSRMRPMYAVNSPSTKLELQSRSEPSNNSATSKFSSAQVRTVIPVSAVNDYGQRVGSKTVTASRSIDSSSIPLQQHDSKFPHNSSIHNPSQAGKITSRDSLKHRGEGRYVATRITDAMPQRSVENPRKDILTRNDFQRQNDAKFSQSAVKPVVASHQIQIGKSVEPIEDDSKINLSPVRGGEDSITWSVNELRKQFDVTMPKPRLTQRNSIKKQ